LTVPRVLLGVITGAHGIRGDVKIKSFTGDPEAIATYGPLMGNDGRVIEVLRIKRANDFFIASLKDVADRTAAEALRGVELFGAREHMGEDVLLSDLVGRQVAAGLSMCGRITGFHDFGAGEIMELEDGLLIPVRFIQSTDEIVRVNLPEGFLDPPAID
jgi:16S rRNA processing protein RimM